MANQTLIHGLNEQLNREVTTLDEDAHGQEMRRLLG